MNKFELSPAFLIGHEEIDSDHAELIKIINELIDGFLMADLRCCQKKWRQFHKKLEQHFTSEEKIMVDFGFIEEEHAEHHQKLLDNAITLGEKCNSLEDWKACIQEVQNNFLLRVLKHDLKFAEHLVTIGYNEV